MLKYGDEIMITREDIFKYVKENFNTEPDYPWARTPTNAILRHKTSRKWYGAIVNIPKSKLGIGGNEEINALLLKSDPPLIALMVGQKGIYPAYHMNKEHWLTIVLETEVNIEDVFKLINISYEITKKKYD